MPHTLQRIEKEIAATWEHINHQRHIVATLREIGHSQDVPTAEVLLETLTASLELLRRQKEMLLEEPQKQSAWPQAKARLHWISK